MLCVSPSAFAPLRETNFSPAKTQSKLREFSAYASDTSRYVYLSGQMTYPARVGSYPIDDSTYSKGDLRIYRASKMTPPGVARAEPGVKVLPLSKDSSDKSNPPVPHARAWG